MQPSTESLSTSDENNSQEIKDFKETVLDLLNKENILENDIIKASNELRLHPLLSIDIQEKLINEESFEMLKLSIQRREKLFPGVKFIFVWPSFERTVRL